MGTAVVGTVWAMHATLMSEWSRSLLDTRNEFGQSMSRTGGMWVVSVTSGYGVAACYTSVVPTTEGVLSLSEVEV